MHPDLEVALWQLDAWAIPSARAGSAAAVHASGVLACDEAEVVVGAARRAGRKPTSTLIVDIGDEDDLLTVVRDLRVEGREAARLLVTARALEPIEHAAGAERL